MHLVYMGTPEFAVGPLEKLHRSEHTIAAVVTSPDRPRGRGLKKSPTPVKTAAQGLGLPLLEPADLNDYSFFENLKSFNPDLNVIVAFRILPERIFCLPRFGSVNLHASLLPEYRGAAPINRALIDGRTRTGVTTFFLNKKVDTGDILLQREVEIAPEDDFGTLHDKLAEVGAEVLLQTIEGIERGTLTPRPQSLVEGSRAPKITPETGLINWDWPAERISNLVRGLSPLPGAYSFLDSMKIILLKAEVIDRETALPPGMVVDADPRSGIIVACGRDELYLLKLKPQGKREMNSAEFVRGHHVKIGSKFSNLKQG